MKKLGIIVLVIVIAVSLMPWAAPSASAEGWDPWEYDTDNDGVIQKTEAIGAVQDYFGGGITKMQAIQVVMLYFQGPPPDDYTLEESQTIDAEGGELTIDDFSLTVPPGAFDSAAELELYASSQDRPFGDNGVSRTFRLEGLPPYYSQPLPLGIKYQGTLSEESFIAVGEKALILGTGEEETAYDLFPATESSGYLLGELPARGGSQASYEGKWHEAGTDGDIGEEKYLECQAITGTCIYETEHFDIKYPCNLKNVVVPNLANYLEDAYNIFEQMEFNYEQSVKPMDLAIGISVLVKKPEGWGAYAKSSFGWFSFPELWCYLRMEFNASKMTQANLPQIRIAAGREFFRGVIPAIYCSSALYFEDWIDRSVAIWCEEKFTDEPNYVPPDFIGNEMAPFNKQPGSADYEKGMSALIEYLVNSYKESILVKIYEGIASGLLSVEAISNGAGAPVNEWWPDFCKKYVSGDVYGVSSSVFTNPAHLSGVFNISADDPLEIFSAKYRELSAKIYRINLPHKAEEIAKIGSDAEIRFHVNSTEVGEVAIDDMEILVFKLKGGSLQYFDGWIVSDVRDLAEQGYDLLAVVVNSTYSGWQKEGDIELRVELVSEEPVEFPYDCCEIRVDVIANYQNQDGDTWTGLYELITHPQGGFTGNKFEGLLEGSGGELRETTTVTVDPVTLKVTSFEVKGTCTTTSPETTWGITGGNGLPLGYGYGEVLSGSVYGEEACNYISSVYYDNPGSSGYTHVTLARCDASSYLSIRFLVLPE